MGEPLTPIFGTIAVQHIVLGAAHALRAIQAIVDDLKCRACILGGIGQVIEKCWGGSDGLLQSLS